MSWRQKNTDVVCKTTFPSPGRVHRNSGRVFKQKGSVDYDNKNMKRVATWLNKHSGCAHSEDSDQPWHPPSPIRVFAVRMKKAWVLSYPLSAQRRPWSDWADAQADLSLRWAHSHFVGFAKIKHQNHRVRTVSKLHECKKFFDQFWAQQGHTKMLYIVL